MLAVRVEQESWPLREPLVIKGYVFPTADIVTVTLDDGMQRGRGEAAGVYYRGETLVAMEEDIRRVASAGDPLDRDGLQQLLAPGGARNALDCALWELEARREGKPVWHLAELPEPRPLRTTITLGADAVGKTVAAARGLKMAKALKLKLAGDGEDAARIAGVRAERPDVWLAVDANQALDLATLAELEPTMMACKVSLVEQPLPVGQESQLRDLPFPIPIAADESVQSSADLEALAGCFQVINIKLDKCGGLTEALGMASRARSMGFGVMVGNMTCTSLGLAPGFVLGQICDIVDLDGPTFLRNDRPDRATYLDGDVYCGPHVWGGGGA